MSATAAMHTENWKHQQPCGCKMEPDVAMKLTNMKWDKKGLIFDPQNNHSGWINNYAALPVADLVDDKTLRIYFSCRDGNGRSVPTFLECDPENPEDISYIHSEPILDLGPLGTFDDNGIMPSCIVNHGGQKLLYYIGWNPQVTVSYRLSVGLATSVDGRQFKKLSDGPICDRALDEPYFNTAPWVIKERDGLWKMWYVSCTKWEMIMDWPEPFYNIKYAESEDGINWRKTGITCIDYDHFTEAIGKPFVQITDGIYRMYYSYRNATCYRNDPTKSYRLGYAESHDGKEWKRADDKMGLSFSETGWDSIMMEYSSGYRFNNKEYIIYNGNGFGKSGFGYAVRNLI